MMQRSIRNLRTENEDLYNKLSAKEGEMKGLYSRINQLIRKAKNSEKQDNAVIEELKAEIARLEALIDEQQAEIDALKKENEQLKEDNTTLNEEVTAKTEENKQLADDNVVLQSENQTLTEKVNLASVLKFPFKSLSN